MRRGTAKIQKRKGAAAASDDDVITAPSAIPRVVSKSSASASASAAAFSPSSTSSPSQAKARATAQSAAVPKARVSVSAKAALPASAQVPVSVQASAAELATAGSGVSRGVGILPFDEAFDRTPVTYYTCSDISSSDATMLTKQCVIVEGAGSWTTCPTNYHCNGSTVAYSHSCGTSFTNVPDVATMFCDEAINMWIPCPSGVSCNGDTDVWPCPAGAYCPEGSSAQDCPPSTYNPYTGAADDTSCIGVSFGYYAPRTQDDTAGSTNTYGASAQYPCPVVAGLHLFCPGFDSDIEYRDPIMCPPGFYETSNSEGVASLSVCPVGRYCPGAENATLQGLPLTCSDGHWSEGGANATASETACGLCEEGYFCAAGVKTLCSVSSCPPGSFVDSDTAGYYLSDTTYVACEPGTYCPGSNTSMSCPPGSYCPDPTMTMPLPCPAGYSCPEEGTITPDICLVGYFCPEGSSGMSECESGTICSVSGMSDSELCPAGYYCPNTPSGVSMIIDLVTCPTDSYCPAGSLAPLACTASNTLCSTTGLASPPACPQGWYCPGGQYAEECTNPNIYCPTVYDQELVPDGSSKTSNWEITSCPAGFTCENGQATECGTDTYCPEGSTIFTRIPYTAGMVAAGYPPGHPEQASTYSEVPVGSYTTLNPNMPHNGDFSQAWQCPAGFACAGGIDSEPLACGMFDGTIVGYFASQPGQGDCEMVQPGYYIDPSAASTETDINGNNGFSSQTPCPAGSTCDGSGNTQSCAAGFYCDGTDSTDTMVACPKGTFNAGDSGDSSFACMPCSIGNFCPTTATTVPTECPAGSYCPSTGLSVSLFCPPGSFSDMDGQSACSACPAGSYSFGYGNDSCLPCTDPAFCQAASTADFQVGPGYYLLDIVDAGLAGVHPTLSETCLSSTYCPGDGYSYTCPAGAVCPDVGMEMPQACPEGTFNPYEGKVSPDNFCLVLANGSYCSLTTEDIDNFMFDPAACVASHSCAPGFTCSGGIDAPQLCPEGFYCPGGGADKISCPNGSFCPTGSSLSLDVEQGTYATGCVDDFAIGCGLQCTATGSCPPGLWCPGLDQYRTLLDGDTNPMGCEFIGSGSCAAGYYSNAGTNFSCTAVEPGYYEEDHTDSYPCEVMFACPGAAAPVACGVGSYSEGGWVECSATEAGTYVNGLYTDTCVAGKYCPEGKEPVICYAGSIVSILGGGMTADEATAFYCPEGSVLPIAVPPGSTSAIGEGDHYALTDCPAAYYCPGGDLFSTWSSITTAYPIACPMQVTGGSTTEACGGTRELVTSGPCICPPQATVVTTAEPTMALSTKLLIVLGLLLAFLLGMFLARKTYSSAAASTSAASNKSKAVA